MSSNTEDDIPEEEEEDAELDASETESDEDESEDAEEEDASGTKTKEDIVIENIFKRYEDRQGKQLYIRFPHKLPLDETEFQTEVQALSPLITKAHKPRQKYARFCLVDFNTKDDRDATLKSLRAKAKKEKDFKIVASIPRTENTEFVKELAERKLKSLENKRAKARLKRASKAAVKSKNFTSSIVVQNVPKSSSMAEIRKVFPNAVDIQLKPSKDKMDGTAIATITLPSTMEARAAVKQKKILGGTQLNIRFDVKKFKKNQQKQSKAKKLKPLKENKTKAKKPVKEKIKSN